MMGVSPMLPPSEQHSFASLPRRNSGEQHSIVVFNAYVFDAFDP
jgi:hypothetical protein